MAAFGLLALAIPHSKQINLVDANLYSTQCEVARSAKPLLHNFFGKQRHNVSIPFA